MIDFDKEVQLLHQMAFLAELVDGTRRTHKISDKYTMFMMETRVSLVCNSEYGNKQVISACVVNEEDDSVSDDAPFMTPGNIYIYNRNANTKIKLYSQAVDMSKQYEEREVLLVDFRDRSTESDIFQLQTVMNTDEVLGVVLHSQIYNFLLPGLEHYRRTFVEAIPLDYDELLHSITKIIEAEHASE